MGFFHKSLVDNSIYLYKSKRFMNAIPDKPRFINFVKNVEQLKQIEQKIKSTVFSKEALYEVSDWLEHIFRYFGLFINYSYRLFDYLGWFNELEELTADMPGLAKEHKILRRICSDIKKGLIPTVQKMKKSVEEWSKEESVIETKSKTEHLSFKEEFKKEWGMTGKSKKEWFIGQIKDFRLFLKELFE